MEFDEGKPQIGRDCDSSSSNCSSRDERSVKQGQIVDATPGHGVPPACNNDPTGSAGNKHCPLPPPPPDAGPPPE